MMIMMTNDILSFPDICLTVEKNPRQKPQPGKLNRRVSKPDPLGESNDVTPRPQQWSNVIGLLAMLDDGQKI